jgi:DNA-binding Lrp family transcriptional regulator
MKTLLDEDVEWRYNNEWDWEESMPIWEDSDLCAAAKGVWAYMRSRPHGWDFSAERIGKALGLSKKTALKHMKELEEKGYLYGRRVKNRRMEYSLSSSPHERPFRVEVDKLGHFPKPKNQDYVESMGATCPTLKAAVEYLALAYSAYGNISPSVIEDMLTVRAKWGSYADLSEWMVENKALICGYFGINEVDYGF